MATSSVKYGWLEKDGRRVLRPVGRIDMRWFGACHLAAVALPELGREDGSVFGCLGGWLGIVGLEGTHICCRGG